MTTFADLGLSQKALRAVARLGYAEPTPVQEQAIPVALDGRDVIAGAQTGTGKTAAFCLPCMDKLDHAGKGAGPIMLVITPTRELASQIGEVAEEIAKQTKHRVLTVVGGVSYRPQTEGLRRGCDVLIATPGRLEDLISQDAADLSLVTTLVIDEADRMLDMGFLPAVERIVKRTNDARQTLLFSATIDKEVGKFAKRMLHDPAKVEVAHTGETADTVDQYIVRIAHAAKPSLLAAVLREHGGDRVIVFARTRHRADSCARRIRKAGFSVDVIHSGKSQNQRKRALEAFTSGRTGVLVATDVLARGIDVSDVSYVVNYDMPMQPEDYVHRIGRTGRAGQRGMAISFVSPETEAALRDVEKFTGQRLEVMQVANFDRTAAEAEAAERQLQNELRREKDPEVARVKREMAAEKKAQARKDKARARKRSLAQGAQKAALSAKSQQSDGLRQSAGAGQPANSPKPKRRERSYSEELFETIEREEAAERGAVKPGKGAKAKRTDVRKVSREQLEEASRTEGRPSRDARRKGKAAHGRAQDARPAKSQSRTSGRKAEKDGELRGADRKRAGKPRRGGSKPGKPAGSRRDVRPGRAHRAEVRASRRDR